MNILLIGNDRSAFDALAKRLGQEDGVRLVFAGSGATVLELMREKGRKAVDLVILGGHLSDMAGIRFVRQLVRINPLVQAAVIGSLPDKDFHEATEGLGVLLQLPRYPKEQHAETLLASLKKIAALMQPPPLGS
jgi:CheY-like chemotaxis protein